MLLKFWVVDGPTYLVRTTYKIALTTANILSIELLLKTFFAPWKGEYRKGYVAIARAIGITIRLFTLLVGVVILYFELLLCLTVILIWIAAPLYLLILFVLGVGGVA